jgi:hypothetical protein
MTAVLDRRSPDAGRARRRLPGRWWPAGLLVGDLVLAVALFGRAWAHPASVTAGARQDAPYLIWAFEWVVRALRTGTSPWVTHALSWPSGVNLMTNATATGLGLVLAPITWAFGPLVAYDVAATAAVGLTAWSAQLTIRRAGLASWPAAAVGGLVGGFGVTSLVQTGGDHLHVSSAYLVPPLLLGVGRLASGTARSPVRWGAALGALTVAQLLIGEEILAITVCGAVAGVVIAAVAGRVVWRDLALGGLAAAATFVALAAYPLFVQFAGPEHITGAIQSGPRYANDLAGFVVPTSQTSLAWSSARSITRHFSSEGGAYLGVPLMVTAAVTAVAARRRAGGLVGILGGTAAAVAVLSLGTRLTIDGHRYPIPLPWAVPAHAPLLDSLLPVRFGILLDLLAGALLAVALDAVAVAVRTRRPSGRHLRTTELGPRLGMALAAALAVACVAPLVPHLPLRTTRWDVPAAFASPGRAGVADGALIVVSPYPSQSEPQIEVWLAAAGDRWRTSGGTYLVPGRQGRVTLGGTATAADVVDATIANGAATPVELEGDRTIVRAELARDRVAAVLVGPGPRQALVADWWRALLGAPAVVGDVDVWRLSPEVQGSGATRAMAATAR